MNNPEPFYATLKLTTAEEVLAEVMPSHENGTDFLILNNPILISEAQQVDPVKGVIMSGLVPRKWMMYSNEDLTIVYRQHVIAISEMDKFGADFYKKALIAAKVSSPIKKKVDTEKSSGYLGKIDSFRRKLDQTFDSSPDLSEQS